MTPGPIRCRVCGSADCTPLGPPARRQPTKVAGVPIDISDLNQQFVRCNDCGYAFIDPCIPESRLLDCYSRSPGTHWDTGASVASHRFYDRKRDLLLKYLGAGRKVLDFGCYDGGFLDFLGDGFDRWGIEPSQSAADRAVARGVKVLAPTVEAVDPSAAGTFDGIVAFDVLEHLVEPVPVLSALARLLKPGGVFVVETGNYDAPAFRKRGPRYAYAAIVEHVGFFNRSSLAEVARRSGLQLVDFRTSQHSQWPTSPLRDRLVNAGYYTLRGLHALKIPLPASWANVARGPVPRVTDLHDHFMAALNRTSAAG